MKTFRILSSILIIALAFNTGCRKIEDLFSGKKSESAVDPASSGNFLIIATRKDASVEIKSFFTSLINEYKQGSAVQLPDNFEVYISENEGKDWDLVKTVDSSFLKEDCIISGLKNDFLYYLYMKAKKDKVVIANSKVVRFVPSAFKPTCKFLLADYHGSDLYSFGVSDNTAKTIYATLNYEFQQGYSSPAIFLSKPGNAPQLIDIKCWFPDLSRDGNFIAYSSNKGEVFDGHLSPEHITIYDISTNKSTRMTSGYSVNKFPAWSPKNGSFVYSSSEISDETLKIRLFNAETGKSQILETRPTISDNLLRYNQEQPAWSPDGKYIYYTHHYFTDDNVNPGYYDIYRIISTGGAPEPILTSNKIESTPTISPDNSRLAFLSDYNGTVQIWIYTFADKKFHQPIDSYGYDFSEIRSKIKWSDNNTILFTCHSEEKGGAESLFSITVE